MQAYFEPIAKSQACEFCIEMRPAPSIEIDAAYCISLVEQPHRMKFATAQFHQNGLCRLVTFYRPHRLSSKTSLGVWVSHRAVARKALSEGQRRVLIMEDDVVFRQPMSSWAPRVNRALKKLPQDWWGLFLGHLPIQSYFVGYGLLRTRSAALHAYIAHTPLLRWYDETEPRAAEVPMWRPIARSVDAATSNLPGMYAIYPMVAFQKDFSDGRVDTRYDPDGRRRGWSDVDRWRSFLLFRAPRLIEFFAILWSPLHRLTMDYVMRRIEMQARPAKDIRASGLFDDSFYLTEYPDIGAAGVDPLIHYIDYGAKEGRWPNAFFDPAHYAKQATDLKPGENPLLHYLRVGRARGYSTSSAK